MYLVFDTETTGIPRVHNAPTSDLENWPRVVQLAWASFDKHGRKTGAASYLIRPDGFKIPKEAERIHGISTQIAKRRGIVINKVLEAFLDALYNSSVLVAHNFKFDAGVLGAEFFRFRIRRPFSAHVQVCTMEAATEYCALAGNYGYKWPRLSELHFKLFRKRIKETHDAADDVATCAKCFFELKRLGVIRAGKRMDTRRR